MRRLRVDGRGNAEHVGHPSVMVPGLSTANYAQSRDRLRMSAAFKNQHAASRLGRQTRYDADGVENHERARAMR
jgi:hypothetical protein